MDRWMDGCVPCDGLAKDLCCKIWQQRWKLQQMAVFSIFDVFASMQISLGWYNLQNIFHTFIQTQPCHSQTLTDLTGATWLVNEALMYPWFYIWNLIKVLELVGKLVEVQELLDSSWWSFSLKSITCNNSWAFACCVWVHNPLFRGAPGLRRMNHL